MKKLEKFKYCFIYILQIYYIPNLLFIQFSHLTKQRYFKRDQVWRAEESSNLSEMVCHF